MFKFEHDIWVRPSRSHNLLNQWFYSTYILWYGLLSLGDEIQELRINQVVPLSSFIHDANSIIFVYVSTQNSLRDTLALTWYIGANAYPIDHLEGRRSQWFIITNYPCLHWWTWLSTHPVTWSYSNLIISIKWPQVHWHVNISGSTQHSVYICYVPSHTVNCWYPQVWCHGCQPWASGPVFLPMYHLGT